MCASAELLTAVGEQHPPLRSLVSAIVAFARADEPTGFLVDAIAESVEALEALDLGDPPRAAERSAEERVYHDKFGAGLVLRRQDDKVWVRFEDGTERVLLSRFVRPAEP